MNKIISEEYRSVGLRVKVDYIKNKIYIDFSAKLLLVEYVSKINIFNIREIYKEIRKIIKISPFQFLRLTPNYCETVSDIHIENIPETVDALFSISKLQDGFKPSPKLYKCNNSPTSFTLKKNVLSRESSEYISIYSKYNEMFKSNKNENIAYLQRLTAEQINSLKKYFDGVLRVESKCVTKSRIRSSFGLKKEFNMYDLLTSRKNVNDDLFNRVYNIELLPSTTYKNITYKQFDKLNTLKTYDNNLERIYEMHRALGSKIQKSKMMRPYKELLKFLTIENETKKIKIIENVKEKIKW